MKHGKKTLSSLPIVPIALLYFLLFGVSIVANYRGNFLHFPKTNANFWNTLLTDTLFGIIIGILMVGLFNLLDKKTDIYKGVTASFKELFQGLSFSDCFMLAAFSSLGEEFFFRGLLQAKFGIWVTSILFGLSHIGPTRSFWSWTVSAAATSVALGYIYEWRGNILVPVVIHFLINLINLRILSEGLSGTQTLQKDV